MATYLFKIARTKKKRKKITYTERYIFKRNAKVFSRASKQSRYLFLNKNLRTSKLFLILLFKNKDGQPSFSHALYWFILKYLRKYHIKPSPKIQRNIRIGKSIGVIVAIFI